MIKTLCITQNEKTQSKIKRGTETQNCLNTVQRIFIKLHFDIPINC